MPITTSSAPSTLDSPLGGSAGPDFGQYLSVCAVLILAAAGLAIGFRKLVAGSLRARAKERSLQVLDVLPLGGKHKLGVVRCYDRSFLLGFGEKEIRLIAELDAAACEPGPVPPEITSAESPNFERILSEKAVPRPFEEVVA